MVVHDGAQGPLSGLKILEVASLGSGPLAAMLLSDMGADVLRVDRLNDPELEDYNSAEQFNFINRGRSSVRVDLKSEMGRKQFLKLVERADVLIEGFRPGVMERLGLGPVDCLKVNPAINFVRITGWGQSGPLSNRAGHDSNYTALSGLLGLLGPEGSAPAIPLNFLGDYAAGGLMGVIGALAAVIETSKSGRGQVIDTAIVDGSALLTAYVQGQNRAGNWKARGTNFLDGGAPYYNIYEAADGGYLAFCAIEERFFQEFVKASGIDGKLFEDRGNSNKWPQMRKDLAEIFLKRSRAEWMELVGDSDSCLTPILDVNEVFEDPHLQARGIFEESFGLRQPAPAPRFLSTPSLIQGLPCLPGEMDDSAKERWGILNYEDE